jgi:hypothetical protein
MVQVHFFRLSALLDKEKVLEKDHLMAQLKENKPNKFEDN